MKLHVMHKKGTALNRAVRKALGYGSADTDAEILAEWRRLTRRTCKPCWELKYCPYGPLVEDFPVLPSLREEAVAHNEYLKSCLVSGKLGNGRPLDNKRRKWFEEQVNAFRPSHYPEDIPRVLKEVECRVFGHICPVFFVAEPFTETKDVRTQSRSVPRDVMLKVVRRDGQICQACFQPVPDNEVEFDHIIPFSKGGPTTVENLKLVHRDCNKSKGDSLKEILEPEFLAQYLRVTNKRTRKVKA